MALRARTQPPPPSAVAGTLGEGLLDRLLTISEADAAELRGWIPLVIVVWVLLGAYDAAIVEMMRPFTAPPGFEVEPALFRSANHLLLLAIVLLAAAILLASLRREASWYQVGLLIAVLALAVGTLERLLLILVWSALPDLTRQPSIFELFDDASRSALTYSVRAALKHTEAFVITALMLIGRHHVLRLMAFERERNLARESDLRLQLAALQNELSPHFLFNALHHAVARTGESPTRTMLVDVAELLRYVLRGRYAPMTTVQDEVEFNRRRWENLSPQERDSIRQRFKN